MNSRPLQADMTGAHFFFLWFGAAVSMAEILTGGLLANMGLKNGFYIILIGHAIGVTILMLGGIIGSRERLPALASTRISFGLYGSYLFSILNILQLIGWTAVMLISAARSVNFISIRLWHFDSISAWTILLGIMVLIWIVSGTAGFKKINVAAVMLLFLLTLILSGVLWKSGKLWAATGECSPADWGIGMEMNIVMPLSWLPLIADYTRFAKTSRAGALGSWAGYFFGSSWMYLIGLGSAIVSRNPDPTPLMMATHLGFAALGVVILATVTTTFLDVYSAGITFLNIFSKFNAKRVAIAMGIIGTMVALVVPIEQYQNFLYGIGSIFAPLFAILLADYFLVKTRIGDASGPELLFDWGAALIWVFGMAFYLLLVKTQSVLGSTLPVMVVAGLAVILFRKGNVQWKLYRRLPEQ